MSAALASTNSFSAHLALAAGVAVSITAPTLDDLSKVVAKLQPAANDGKPPKAPPPAATAAPTPAPTAAPQADTGNEPVSTSTLASAPLAAAGSGAAAEGPRPTYDDVKARVLALAKVGRDKATAALAKFGVDHGNKLPLEQYADFLVHADEVLAAAGAKA